MNKVILFNFASRSRPDRFSQSLQHLWSNLDNTQDCIINVKIDTDDREHDNYVSKCDGHNILLQSGRSVSKIHAINRDIPSDKWWDILVNVSDDTIITAPNFDDIIREHCGADDFLLFPEPFADNQAVKGKNERIAVMSVMGREYYNRDNYVYHPSYKSLWCDNEATQVARARGRLKEIDIPIFYHHHPAAGYKVNDAQYRHTEAFWNEDKANYAKRKEAGFL